MPQMINDILNDEGKIIFCVIILIMITELIAAFILNMYNKAFLAKAKKTTANIIDIKTYNTSKGGRYDNIIISYKDRMGRPYERQVSSRVGLYSIGDSTNILYDLENPQKARLEDDKQMHYMILGMSLSPLIMIIMLIILISQGVAKIPF